jgi:RecA/RadA recombinase
MQRLKPTHFNEETQLDLFIVWFVAQQLWINNSDVPHPQHLKDLAVNVMISEGYVDQNLHDAAVRLVDEIYAFREDPWNVDYGRNLLDVFFNDVFSKQIITLAQQAQSRDLALQDMLSTHQQLSVKKNLPFDPFDLSVAPTLSKRIPTGATYFDLVTGGGTTPTECYGILGPSGGGKTLMAIDIGCSMAERGQRVEYFLYEQPAQEVRPRLFSRAGGISTDDMRNRAWDELSEDVRDRIARASEQLKGKFILHDRSAEGDSVSDVANAIRESIAEGKKPDLVVIDWLWPLVTRAAGSAVAGGRKNVSERIVMQGILDEFKAMASTYKVCILILHQLSTEIAKKRASRKPQWFNSAEAGSFAWLLHHCIAIGTQDDHGYCWLVGSKARTNAKMSLIVQCLGQLNKFKMPKKDMTYDDTKKEFVDTENQRRMPGRENQASPGSEEEDVQTGLV